MLTAGVKKPYNIQLYFSLEEPDSETFTNSGSVEQFFSSILRGQFTRLYERDTVNLVCIVIYPNVINIFLGEVNSPLVDSWRLANGYSWYQSFMIRVVRDQGRGTSYLLTIYRVSKEQRLSRAL